MLQSTGSVGLGTVKMFQALHAQLTKLLSFYRTGSSWLTAVADLGEGPGGPGPPLFWVKKEEMTEGKMAGRASKSRPGSPLSSRSGSATEQDL